MNKLVLAVYDIKASCHLTPFMTRTLGEAHRLFEDAVNDPKTPLNAHPDDFILVKLAEFNEVDGVYTPCTREEISTARSVIKEVK